MLSASVCGGRPAAAGSGRRRASHTTLPGVVCCAASARSPGATGASTSNRLPRSPVGTSGISSCADIGLIIVTSPSGRACSRPMGAR